MKSLLIPPSRSHGADEGWAVTTTLIGGFAVWGGLGWVLDRWLETRLFTPIGLIVGMALGIYAVVARFGLAAEPDRALKAARQRADRDMPPPVGTREETECP